MAKPDQVKDAELRALINSARTAYLNAEQAESVHKSTEAFLGLLKRQPDFFSSGPNAGTSRVVWPRLGAILETSEGSPPRIVYDRETFSTSEAITYYEFALDSIVTAGL